MFDFLRADLFFGGGIWPCDANTMRRLKKKQQQQKKKNPLFSLQTQNRDPSQLVSSFKNPLAHRDVIMSKPQCGATFSAV